MRELYIQFSKEPPRIHYIDEKKRYFATEVQSILDRLRDELQKTGTLVKKKYNLYVDGVHLLTAYIDLAKADFENQIKNIIKNADVWKDDLKQKYLNYISDYIQSEKEAFLDENFREFACHLENEFSKWPISMSLKQYKVLYHAFSPKITGNILNYVDGIAKSVIETFDIQVRDLELDEKNAINEWFTDEQNFKDWVQFCVAKYFSHPYSRVEEYAQKDDLYLKSQDYLFQVIALENFERADDKNEYVQDLIYERWLSLLKSGAIIDTDDKIKANIIEPVIEDFFKKESQNENISDRAKRFLEELGFYRVKDNTLQSNVLNEVIPVEQNVVPIIEEKDKEEDQKESIHITELIKMYRDNGIQPELISAIHGMKEEYDAKEIVTEISLLVDKLEELRR